MVLGPENGQVSLKHASGVPGLEELEVQLVAISIIKRIISSFDGDNLCTNFWFHGTTVKVFDCWQVPVLVVGVFLLHISTTPRMQ